MIVMVEVRVFFCFLSLAGFFFGGERWREMWKELERITDGDFFLFFFSNSGSGDG
jgi:hypothetical protein